MSHPSEEDLVLHLYGESSDEEAVKRHVESCRECRDEIALLKQVLAEVDEVDVPGRPDDYGERVWERLSEKLPRSRRWGSGATLFAGLAAAAALLLATFLAGRLTAPRDVDESEVRERVLLVALGRHLEESQILLLEVANRDDLESIPLDRERAVELLHASRLYRQSAYRVGDVATADVLEELERLLLDVSHGPDSAEALSAVRGRLEERDLLFKLRVLESNVRRREQEPITKF